MPAHRGQLLYPVVGDRWAEVDCLLEKLAVPELELIVIQFVLRSVASLDQQSGLGSFISWLTQ
jgi:hypothetical protein